MITIVGILCFCDVILAIDHTQSGMAGEATQSSIILQSRLAHGRTVVPGDVPGARGVGCFEVSENPDFSNSLKTNRVKAIPDNDFMIKQKVANLRSGTRYYYRLLYGPDKKTIKRGNSRTFRTLDGASVERKTTFVVVTGMNYHRFHYGPDSRLAYRGPDKNLGYPGLKTILDMEPDFFVGTGDNVYYDVPLETAAKTRQQLRKKWHEQFAQQRYVDLFAKVPTYWEKDDHDYRYDDTDNTVGRMPSPALGKEIFLEQLPVADPAEAEPITYRTYRTNKLLQIWLVEGRDYRSSNSMPDGPDKTIWGEKQKRWLKNTLLESEATFKILISPTPMIGPDDMRKSDNHTNPKGFRYEGEEFFSWLLKNGFLQKNFYIVCGDRHWQYHSIGPAGFEEFSCGALVDANSRLGRRPGDPKSTDPRGLVKQRYLQKEASGGFLAVTTGRGPKGEKPYIRFAFYDEKGKALYECRKTAGSQ